jgi:HAE1 family hydrophobic/amphiphilic exporter-1
MILKPWEERGPDQNASKLVADVRGKLLQMPEAFALSFDPPSIPGIGTTGGFEFVVEDLKFTGELTDGRVVQMLHFRKLPVVPEQIVQSAHGLFHNILVLLIQYSHSFCR